MKILNLILFTFLILTTFTKKKSKKSKKSKKEEKFEPVDYKPQHITWEHYCDECKKTVEEVLRRSRGKKTESDIIEVLQDMCDPEKYREHRN
jgi:hypothetical protein